MPRKPAQSSSRRATAKPSTVSGQADAEQTVTPPVQSDSGNMAVRDINEQVAEQLKTNDPNAASDGEPFRPKK